MEGPIRRRWWPTVLLGFAALFAALLNPRVQFAPATADASARPCLRYGDLECCYGEKSQADLSFLDDGIAADRCARYGDVECCYVKREREER